MHIFHKWVPISAEAYDQLFTFTRGPKAGETITVGDITLVLKRCSCGKTRTQQLQGVFTLEQLTKEVR